MILPWKYGAYLSTLFLLYSSGLFCRTFLEAGVAHSLDFCPGGIGLCVGIGLVVFEELGRAGQPALSLLATRSSSLDGKASLVVSDAWLNLFVRIGTSVCDILKYIS